MFDHIKEYNIYIKPGFTDMRKRAGSLLLLVRSEMGMEPILDGIIKGKMIAFGAFDKGTVIGFAVIGTEFFGSINQYLQLIEFEVSYSYRGKGIG